MFYSENVDNVNVINRAPCFFQLETDSDNFDQNDSSDDRLIDHYTDCLLKNDAAMSYLAGRGLMDPNLILEFRLGYADRTLGLSLQKLENDQEQATRGKLQLIGLLKPSGHEFFHGSIVFPFIDEWGHVTGGYGRRITPKLKSNSVYHVHWNPNQSVFFNQKALKRYKRIIMCKTPLEALSYWSLGFRNVVATLGLRQFNEFHLLALQQYGVEEVLIAFDNDRKGSAAARLIAQILSSYDIGCRRIRYPREKDANDCLLYSQTPKGYFEALLNRAKPCRQSYSSIENPGSYD